MSRQNKPLHQQMTPEDYTQAKLLITKISICNDLLYGAYTSLKFLLKSYHLSHQKLHDLGKIHSLSAAFSAANSKSLGNDMAVDFGELCDAISEGIDELFVKKLHEQGKGNHDGNR